MRALTLPIALFVAALVVINAPANTLTNQQPRTKVQTVQAEAPRKELTASSQEKALTEQKAVVEPEQAVATQEPIKAFEPAPQTQGCEAYRPLLSKYDWDVHIALAIMQAESGCNPSGPPSATCDRGLMQINCVHADMVNSLDDLYNPTTNIQVAYRVYLSQGWRGWSTYTNGAYLKFL